MLPYITPHTYLFLQFLSNVRANEASSSTDAHLNSALFVELLRMAGLEISANSVSHDSVVVGDGGGYSCREMKKMVKSE